MAWTESYHCDVCGIAKSDDQRDWWLAFAETFAPTSNATAQPALRVTPWNDFLAHSADVIHLCGSRCAHTELDRWMTPVLGSLHS